MLKFSEGRNEISLCAAVYCAAEWENGGKVYEKLGIKHWKDFLPDMSRIMPDMVKKKVTKQSREQGMGVLIAETCVAECVTFG